MTQNTTNAPEAQIETIVVDPDDIVTGARFNGQPPEYKNRRAAVIRLQPPFGSKVVGGLHYHESGNYYPPEVDPKPIHLRPELFIKDSMYPVPNRGDVRAEARDELEARGELDDMTEDEIEEYKGEWVEEAFEVWESDARTRLVDELSESENVWGRDEVDVLAGVSVEYTVEN